MIEIKSLLDYKLRRCNENKSFTKWNVFLMKNDISTWEDPKIEWVEFYF